MLTQLIAVTGGVDLHCVVTVGPAGFLHHRIFLLPFAVNKYLGGRAAGVAQSVKHPTVGFHSGHDLRIMGLSPALGLHSAQSLLEILSHSPFPSASVPLLLTCTLSLSNK